MIAIYTSPEEIDDAQWKHLSDTSPTSSFFQTKACYDFYVSLSFLEPFLFGVSDNGCLVGLVCGYTMADGGKIKRFFSRRAIIPGGLLLDENISDEALQTLLRHSAKQLKKKAIYIEVRNYNDYSSFRSSFEKTGFQYKQHFDFHLIINEETKHKFSESKQRQIKTAQRKGVRYTETKDVDEIKAFYTILKKQYKKRIRLPLFPLIFFLKLSELSQGKILVVKHDNIVIGGMACVALSDKVLYEWFVCGARDTDKHLYPSVMATYAGVDYAIKNRFEKFDFMGAGHPGAGYGVREFKAKFGGKLVEYGRFLYIANPLLYKFGKMIVQLIKHRK